MFFDYKNLDYYIETKVDYPVLQDLPSNEGNLNAFIGVYIQMDDTEKHTVRTAHTFVESAFIIRRFSVCRLYYYENDSGAIASNHILHFTHQKLL